MRGRSIRGKVTSMAHLFDPLTIRDLTFASRVRPTCARLSSAATPMMAFVHLGTARWRRRARADEATAVLPRAHHPQGPRDLEVDTLSADADRQFHHNQGPRGCSGAAGRKASTYRQGKARERSGSEGAGECKAPSALLSPIIIDAASAHMMESGIIAACGNAGGVERDPVLGSTLLMLLFTNFCRA